MNSNAEWDQAEGKYVLHRVHADEELRFEQKRRKFVVRVVPCEHSVPTVGYMFYEVRCKLKSEYAHLSGREIGAVRKVCVCVWGGGQMCVYVYVCVCVCVCGYVFWWHCS
jgi:hypothetical protein